MAAGPGSRHVTTRGEAAEPCTVLATEPPCVSAAGGQQRGPLSSGGGRHRPESHGEAELLQPLPTGLAVQGRCLLYVHSQLF